VVREESQGQGVGGRLLPASLAQAKDIGAWALKASTDTKNQEVHRVLEKSGFRPVVRTRRKIEYFLRLDGGEPPPRCRPEAQSTWRLR